MNKQKRLLSLIMALAMIISLVPSAVFAADGNLEGAGTAESPYLIYDEDDLIKFNQKVSEKSDVCAELAGDITLSEEWLPIGSSMPYSGTFDGKNHEISGLTIATEATNQGLFGQINGATVKNLRVDGNVTCGTKNYIGGIVGKIQLGTIENCSFGGTVKGGYAGGIVGGLTVPKGGTVTISGCANTASVTGTTAGGILGCWSGNAKLGDAVIQSCYNTGAINGSSRTGGIVGQLNKGTVSDCYNIGEITGTNIDGICGFKATVSDCFYTNPETGKGVKVSSPAEMKLSNVFVADENNINNGYPILAWQTGKTVEKNPHIDIVGVSTLEMTNSGIQPSTTLEVAYEDMDDKPYVEWTVTEGADLVTAEPPSNPDESNSKLVVTAKHAGTAAIKAEAGEYAAEYKVYIIPFITSIQFNNSPITEEYAVGSTVCVNVNTLDGEYDYENFPKLKYQWRSNGNDIPGATERTYTIEEKYADTRIDCVVQNHEPSNLYIRAVGAEYANLLSDAKTLSIDTSDIKENTNIKIPSKGEKGTDIAWTSDSDAINAENGNVVIPDEGIAAVTLTAKLSYKDKYKIRKFNIKVYSKAAAEEELNNKQKKLESVKEKLGTLTPVYGEDKNILDMMKADVKSKSDENISVVLKSTEEVYGGASIAENGDITYYYRNPNETAPLNFASYNAVFELSLDDAVCERTVPVIINWDREKVKAVMKEEILDKTKIDANTDEISLPRVIDNKMWTLISWESSDPKTISISDKNQQTADTKFNPYAGIVRRGTEDKKVTLTAKFVFGFTNDVIGSEEPIVMTKVFDVDVKAIDKEKAAEIEAELLKKLDGGFEKVGITDASTGEKLTDENGIYTVKHDIKFPTTRDFGVDGKETPIIISSSDEDTIQSPDVNNAARVTVIRPAAGEEAKTVTVTVSIEDSTTSVSASRSFDFKVLPLTNEEIQSEKELMNKVIDSYFDGIKGANTEKDNIKSNLSSFTEVYEKDGKLVWVRSTAEMSGCGIVPTAMDGWEELEAWRLFKSSNPASITHENLLVNMQKNAKAVNISSALSSETLGIYGKLYKEDNQKYAAYADLADLYYREVNVDLVVRGLLTKANAKPSAVAEKMTVSFRLQSSTNTLIAKTSYSDLPEPATVFDIFKKALEENGYTYKARGSYVYSITTPDGKTFEEFDEGSNSGWMYKVNGKLADCYMGAYGLTNGDDIVVFFTKDFTQVTGGGHSYNYNPSKKDTKTDGKKDDTETKPETVKPKFADIENHWGRNNIEKAAELGIMKGVSDSDFAPDDDLTRGMFVTILYRLEKEPKHTEIKFSDVNSSDWYFDAVAWAKENGITDGISDTEFGPNLKITREQMAVFMYRYAKYLKSVTDINADIMSYEDYNDISEYAVEAMRWAAENKIMSGKSAKTLNPSDTATRAETAAVVMRFING